jgi:hypothetical protein
LRTLIAPSDDVGCTHLKERRMQIRPWVLMLSLAAISGFGCGGDDDDDTAANNGGKKNSENLSATDVAGGACEMMSSSSGAECKGTDDYSTCVEKACSDEYKTCLGAGYKSGNFSGGKCETYFKCVTGSKDKCDNDCELDANCTGCFTGTLASCQLNSGCTLPTCTASGGSGGSSGGAGMTGIPMGNKTCKDVEACCNSLQADQKSTCLMAYNGAKAGGDSVCSILYSTLTGAGCK